MSGGAEARAALDSMLKQQADSMVSFNIDDLSIEQLREGYRYMLLSAREAHLMHIKDMAAVAKRLLDSESATKELLAALESITKNFTIKHRLNNNHEWTLSKHQPDGIQAAIDLIAKVKGANGCQNCVHANQGACCGGVR